MSAAPDPRCENCARSNPKQVSGTHKEFIRCKHHKMRVAPTDICISYEPRQNTRPTK